MGKKIAVIGSGIAGLSAGCYLQMNGYETEIFEMGALPGGLCTSWRKSEFIFDTCIHWLMGSGPKDNLYFLWNELVDMQKIQFVDHEIYLRVDDSEGHFINLYTNLDKLENEMMSKAPEDERLIKAFIGDCRKFLKIKLPVEKAPEVFNLWDMIKYTSNFLPHIGLMNKWIKISIKDYANRCKNPLLRLAFEQMFAADMAMFFMLFTFAGMHNKTSGYPIGGSLNFARLIEERYLSLGGKINYRSKVRRIIVQSGKFARGVLLENEVNHVADIVVSAADGYSTIFKMLEGKFVNRKIQEYYTSYKLFPSYLQVSLGCSREFPKDFQSIAFQTEIEIQISEHSKTNILACRIHNFDPTLAPEGKTVLTVFLSEYDYMFWVNMRNAGYSKYTAEKNRVAEAVISALEHKFGNIREYIEIVDVSTPASVVRYTDNWKGSMEGWMLSPEVGFKQMKKVLPGLKDFYMAGQWVEPGGGLPAALLTARNVSQMICRKDGVKFKTVHF